MWKVKIEDIPVIIGATGTISKLFRNYLSTVPGKHDIRELQKTATVQNTMKNSSVKVQNIQHGKQHYM